jgi:Uma2 family endonuclease
LIVTAVQKPKLTSAEYLVIERKAPFRSEYLNGEMFAMAGASFAHTRIATNLVVALGERFKGGPCYTLSHDMRVKVTRTGLYTYPDVIILCGPPELEDAELDILLNPRVIIEVLSDSTEGYDRGAKFEHYKQVASLQEYVLVSQDEPTCDRYVRGPDETWLNKTFAGLDGVLAFESVSASVPLSEIYAGVTFPEKPTTGLLGPPPIT